jgi:hypothetical protein
VRKFIATAVAVFCISTNLWSQATWAPLVPLVACQADLELASLLQEMEQAVRNDDYSTAQRAGGKAEVLARRLRNSAASLRVAEFRRTINHLEREYKKIAAPLEKIKSSPSDAEAQLRVGLFYGVEKQDWPRALQHSTLATNSTIRKAAQLELNAQANPEAKISIGDGWKEAAEGESGLIPAATLIFI